MANLTQTFSTTFTVTRYTTTTSDPPSICLERLHEQVGSVPVTPVALAGGVANLQELKDRVAAAAGPMGFLSFLEIQHGVWFKLNQYKAETASYPGQRYTPDVIVQLTYGNPIILGNMGKHDINVLMLGPVRMLVVENVKGGTDIMWDLPSSFMVVQDNPTEEFLETVKAFDKKVETLIKWVAYGENLV